MIPTSPLGRFFAALFAAGLLYSFAMLARPDVHFLSRPFIEDAFYSLSVARSLGQGLGMTIDGRTPTNGVQPLICFLNAPAFAIAGDDLYLALRMTLGLQVILAGLAALAVARFAVSLLGATSGDVRPEDVAGPDAARRVRSEIFWIVAGTIASSYSLLVHLQNGLETSLAVALAFIAMAIYIERIARRPDAPIGEFARVGALLGLGVLARIDVAILAMTIAGWHLLTARDHSRRTPALAGAAVIGLVSLLVSLPWWLYNVIGFGHLMPTSGLAQQDLLTDRLRSVDLVVRGVSNALLLVLHAPGDVEGPIAYIGLLLVAAVSAIMFAVTPLRRWAGDALRSLRREVEPARAVPLALFVVILAAYYTLFFGAPHFIPRYLTPMWLLLSVAMLLVLHALWRAAPERGARRTVLLALAVIAFSASAVAASRSFTREGLYTNVMLFPAEWIGAHTSATDRIGMFQSGTTGFLYRRVTNLDGKVNTRALAAMRSGGLARFVDSASFDYIIDLDFYTRHIFRDRRLLARYEPIDTLPLDFIVWRRRD